MQFSSLAFPNNNIIMNHAEVGYNIIGERPKLHFERIFASEASFRNTSLCGVSGFSFYLMDW